MDKATAILPLQPSPIFFLQKEYPGIVWKHHTDVRKRNLKFKRFIVVEDGYVPPDLLCGLNARFGMRLCKYEFEFGVPKDILNVKTVAPNAVCPEFDKASNADYTSSRTHSSMLHSFGMV